MATSAHGLLSHETRFPVPSLRCPGWICEVMTRITMPFLSSSSCSLVVLDTRILPCGGSLKAEGAIIPGCWLTRCSSANKAAEGNLHLFVSLAPRKDPCCCPALQLVPTLKEHRRGTSAPGLLGTEGKGKAAFVAWPASPAAPKTAVSKACPGCMMAGPLPPETAEGSITPGHGAQGLGARRLEKQDP